MKRGILAQVRHLTTKQAPKTRRLHQNMRLSNGPAEIQPNDAVHYRPHDPIEALESSVSKQLRATVSPLVQAFALARGRPD